MSKIAAWVPTWSFLRDWSRNRIVTSSIVWLALVPIAVTCLENAPDTIAVPGTAVESSLGDAAGEEQEPREDPKPLTIELRLPFSWMCLWLAGVFGTVAIVLIASLCPGLLKRFDEYAKYRDSGAGTEYVNEQVIAACKRDQCWVWSRWRCFDEQKALCNVLSVHGALVRLATDSGYQANSGDEAKGGANDEGVVAELSFYSSKNYYSKEPNKVDPAKRSILASRYLAAPSTRITNRVRSGSDGMEQSVQAGYAIATRALDVANLPGRIASALPLLIASALYLLVLVQSVVNVALFLVR